MKEILTPEHKFWNAFMFRLGDGLRNKGCNDKLDIVYQILRTLPDISIAETIEYFEDNGGFCDCEVYMNVGAK